MDVTEFDIAHPTKDGWRLRHASPASSKADIYYRGRIVNNNVIELPDYWFGLIDPKTITVSLTAVGSHQNITIKRIFDNQVHLQSNGGMPIDCFYHVYAERIDIPKLTPEYPEETD